MNEEELSIGTPPGDSAMILFDPAAIVELYAQDSFVVPATTALPAVPA
jgi:hypothetical protein